MKSRNLLIAGIVIEVTSIVVTLASAWFLHVSALEKTRLNFERQVDRGMQAVEARLSQYNRALDAMVGLIYSSDDVSLQEWQTFVASLDIEHNYPGVSGFGLIKRIETEDLPQYLSGAKAMYGPQFQITHLDDPQEDLHFIIDKIEPLARNRAALGLDIASNAVRRNAAIAAMEDAEARITHIILLVQDQAKRPGFLMLCPVYSGGRVPETLEARRQELVGWTYSPFVGEAVLGGIDAMAGPGMKVAIYADEVKEEALIFDGILDSAYERMTERRLNVSGQNWIFHWQADAMGEASIQSERGTRFVLVMGLITCLGLLLIMLLLHLGHQRAIKQAKEALKAKGQFLSVMSHEIRTPINGVIGMSELLLQERLEGNALETARTIHTCGENLLGLVNNILDLSKMEENFLALERRAFDARATVANAVRMLSDKCKSSASLRENLPAQPVWVTGDPYRFSQIVMNLVSNAIKFTNDGFIEVGLSEQDRQIRVWVEDSGIGMDQATIEKIFDPFTQADASISRKYGGTGLGLAIVRDLTKLMNGTLTVTSNVSKGSRFVVDLPFPKAEAVKQATDDTYQTLDLHVLLAEDNKVNQKVATRMLARMGCSFDLAEHGEEVLEKLAKSHADLVLMDCQMPGMDGLEACRRLRAAGNMIPVVAFTANIDERSACLEAGMDGFLTKPISQKELYNALRTLMAQNRIGKSPER